MSFDRQQILDALREMNPDERRDILTEAGGTTDPKEAAAAKLRDFLHGPRS